MRYGIIFFKRGTELKRFITLKHKIRIALCKSTYFNLGSLIFFVKIMRLIQHVFFRFVNQIHFQIDYRVRNLN